MVMDDKGFVLSILWPTIVRLLSESLPQKVLATSSVVMGTTVATGTLVIYGLSSLFAAFNKFKYSFYTASFSVIIVSIIWLLLYDKAATNAKNEKAEEGYVSKEKEDILPQKQQEKYERKMFFVSVYILCFCAVGVNLIKDGLATWVPSILKEEFSLTDSLSILLTLFLPVIAIFGNVFALKIHKKIPGGLKCVKNAELKSECLLSCVSEMVGAEVRCGKR